MMADKIRLPIKIQNLEGKLEQNGWSWTTSKWVINVTSSCTLGRFRIIWMTCWRIIKTIFHWNVSMSVRRRLGRILGFFGINLIFMELKWGVYLSAVTGFQSNHSFWRAKYNEFKSDTTQTYSNMFMSIWRQFFLFLFRYLFLLGIRVSESWFEARGDKTQPKTRLICKCLVVAEWML